jgi:flagellar protein FliO/FliZ
VTLRSFIPLSLLAAAAPLRAADAGPDVAGNLAQMLAGLAIVIGLLLASLWLIKRLSSPRGAAAGLKVLGAVPVGARERVVLVEIAGTVLVLGVTSSNVCTLHNLGADALHEMTGAGAPLAGDPAGNFYGWLRRARERREDGR